MIEETRLTIRIMGKPKQIIRDRSIKIDVEFGLSGDGGFVARRGGADGYFLPPEIIANLDEYKSKDGLVLGFQGSNDRFKLDYRGLEGVMDRLLERIHQLSSQKRWNRTNLPDSTLKEIHRSIDEGFYSNFCLVGGLQPKYVDKGKINQVGIGKIIAAVRGGLTGKDVGMSTAEINRF